MKYLKSHITLIFSLIALLSSYQLFVLVSDTTSAYEQKLANEYSIVAVSTAKLSNESFLMASHLISKVEEIDAKPFFSGYSKDLAPEVYAELQSSFPSFYRIKLKKYPTKEELEEISKAIKKIPGITKVENFARAQNSIASLLNAFKFGIIIYLGITFIFNLLLFIKFMEVWRYEYISRMQIMAIFGAPIWMRSIVLLKMALIDSFFAVVATTAAFYYLSISPDAALYLKSIGVDNPIAFDFKKTLTHLTVISLGVSLFSVLMVAFRRIES